MKSLQRFGGQKQKINIAKKRNSFLTFVLLNFLTLPYEFLSAIITNLVTAF